MRKTVNITCETEYFYLCVISSSAVMLSFQYIVVYIFKMPAMKLAFQESSILFKKCC